ncbi:MAG: hypothetical protein N2445_00600 [Acidobacteria bacterium]|nr:hypothetical protein [Acidobacteriota bacterium]
MAENQEQLLRNLISPSENLGSESIQVTIADFSIVLNGLPQKLKEKIAERYEGFIGGYAENIFSAKVGAGQNCFIPPTEDGMLNIEEKDNDFKTYILSTDFSGFAEMEGRSGFILLARPEDIKFSVYAIENYLMRVFNIMAIEAGGFFIHACGVVKDQKAYLFYGPSGSGKSAVASLSPDLGVLSDDMILIIPKEGDYLASSTPFWGSMSRALRTKGIFSIKGCFHLVKSTETELKKIENIKAMTTLFSSSLFGAFNSKRSSKLFDNIKDFVKHKEVKELALPLKPVFWDLIS